VPPNPGVLISTPFIGPPVPVTFTDNLIMKNKIGNYIIIKNRYSKKGLISINEKEEWHLLPFETTRINCMKTLGYTV
jgi:hypothetical protein